MDLKTLNEKVLSNGLSRLEHIHAMQSKFNQHGEHYIGYYHQWEDIPYDTVSERQKYNVYVPRSPGKHPTILYVHGGAWMIGDRADRGLSMILPLVAHGYAIVTVGYRMTDEAVYPDSVHDVVRGFEAAMERAEEFGLDPENLACMGGSAGTNMALLGAMRSKYRRSFKAAVLRCPLLQLATIREDFEEIGLERKKLFGYPDEDTSIEAMFLGGTPAEVPEAYDSADPIHDLDAEVCPYIFLMHGLDDPAAPYLQSVHFAEAVEKKCGKGKAKVHLYPNTRHDYGMYDLPETFEEYLAFLDEHLRGKHL